MHKAGQLLPRSHSPALNSSEQFALSEYTKAITTLRPHFESGSKGSMRIALITCLLFVCFEFVRSHYQTAMSHLKSGLSLLKDLHLDTSSPAGPWTLLHPHNDFADTTIFETFASMAVQAELLGQYDRNLRVILHTTDPEQYRDAFPSVDHARMALDKVLHGIILFTDSRKASLSQGRTDRTPMAIEAQRRAQITLRQWSMIHDRTFNTHLNMTPRELSAYKILAIYHTMTCILTSTSLTPVSELRFDTHNSDFASIVKQSLTLSNLISETEQSSWADELGYAMSPKLPLFFVATKCRAHHTRWAAVKMLQEKTHGRGGGIWDRELAGRCAEEIVRGEERGFYECGCGCGCATATGSNASDWDISELEKMEILDKEMPVLPEDYRIPDVAIVLPEGNQEGVKIKYEVSRFTASV